jgi:hypothetical protein
VGLLYWLSFEDEWTFENSGGPPIESFPIGKSSILVITAARPETSLWGLLFYEIQHSEGSREERESFARLFNGALSPRQLKFTAVYDSTIVYVVEDSRPDLILIMVDTQTGARYPSFEEYGGCPQAQPDVTVALLRRIRNQNSSLKRLRDTRETELAGSRLQW